MKLEWMFVAFLAGTITSMQVAVNTHLKSHLVHPMQATLISFCVGTLACLIYCLTSGAPTPSLAKLAVGPWWMWIGGLLGTFYVWTSITVAPRIGVAVMVALVIAGQIVMSLAIDHWGLLRSEARLPTTQRLVGAALIVLGAVVMAFEKR